MSYVKCHMSNVICQMSYVKCHMSNVICQMSNVKCQMSYVKCHMSNVICHTAEDQYQPTCAYDFDELTPISHPRVWPVMENSQ